MEKTYLLCFFSPYILHWTEEGESETINVNSIRRGLHEIWKKSKNHKFWICEKLKMGRFYLSQSLVLHLSLVILVPLLPVVRNCYGGNHWNIWSEDWDESSWIQTHRAWSHHLVNVCFFHLVWFWSSLACSFYCFTDDFSIPYLPPFCWKFINLVLLLNVVVVP